MTDIDPRRQGPAWVTLRISSFSPASFQKFKQGPFASQGYDSHSPMQGGCELKTLNEMKHFWENLELTESWILKAGPQPALSSSRTPRQEPLRFFQDPVMGLTFPNPRGLLLWNSPSVYCEDVLLLLV